MDRYLWEDRLIEAQLVGAISNGALLVALKLARAINWCPKNERPAGLYWKNDDAVQSVGASRASFYRYRESLCETGFFEVRGGNLLPTLPESLPETPKESLGETEKSLCETKESLPETEKSLGDNPLSVDIFSEDVLSVEIEETAVADAPTVDSSLNDELEEGGIDMEYLSLLNKGRQDDLVRRASTRGATKEQLDEAAMLLHSNQVQGFDWMDKVTNALTKVGVMNDEDDEEW